MSINPDSPYKIYVYLLPKYASKLSDDAMNFEILKPGNKPNMNLFLNMLIKGYYTQYSNVDEYLNISGYSEESYERRERCERIMIRPSKENRLLFSKIIERHSGSKGVSQYFAKLLMSYCELAMYKREQIVFCDNYNALQKALKHEARTRITFKTKDYKLPYEAIPYKLAIGKDEMFNYLLCAEIYNGKQKEMTFRLNRLVCIDPTPGNTTIETTVERHLAKMERYAPQYIINEDIESCVKLTDKGIKDYKRIYFGRPDRLTERDEDNEDGHYYYFDCSINQLYLYFRRFGCEVEIIGPDELKKSIIDFHSNASAVYEKEK